MTLGECLRVIEAAGCRAGDGGPLEVSRAHQRCGECAAAGNPYHAVVCRGAADAERLHAAVRAALVAGRSAYVIGWRGQAGVVEMFGDVDFAAW